MFSKKMLCLLLILVPLNHGASDELSRTGPGPSFFGVAGTNLLAAAGALREEVAALLDGRSRVLTATKKVATGGTAAAVTSALPGGSGSLPKNADTLRLAMFGCVSMAAAMLLRLRAPRSGKQKVPSKDMGLRPFPREV